MVKGHLRETFVLGATSMTESYVITSRLVARIAAKAIGPSLNRNSPPLAPPDTATLVVEALGGTFVAGETGHTAADNSLQAPPELTQMSQEQLNPEGDPTATGLFWRYQSRRARGELYRSQVWELTGSSRWRASNDRCTGTRQRRQPLVKLQSRGRYGLARAGSKIPISGASASTAATRVKIVRGR